MIPNTNLTIVTDPNKFPEQPGEAEEMVNAGTYGKSLCIFMQERLCTLGYDVPFYCCEDWGWWVAIGGQPFELGICVYGTKDADGHLSTYILASSIVEDAVWVWKQLRMVPTAAVVTKLVDDLEAVLRAEPGIRSIARADESDVRY